MNRVLLLLFFRSLVFAETPKHLIIEENGIISADAVQYVEQMLKRLELEAGIRVKFTFNGPREIKTRSLTPELQIHVKTEPTGTVQVEADPRILQSGALLPADLTKLQRLLETRLKGRLPEIGLLESITYLYNRLDENLVPQSKRSFESKLDWFKSIWGFAAGVGAIVCGWLLFLVIQRKNLV